jgi:hypothetical protein
MSIVSATSARIWQPEARPSAVRNVRNGRSKIELSPRELFELNGDSRWRLIICQRGSVWITQAQDMQDYLLEPGDMFLVTLPGVVLVQALQPASVEITPSLAKAPYRGSGGTFA